MSEAMRDMMKRAVVMMKSVVVGIGLLMVLGGGVCAAPAQKDDEGFVKEDRPATMKTLDESIPAGPLIAAHWPIFGRIVG